MSSFVMSVSVEVPVIITSTEGYEGGNNFAEELSAALRFGHVLRFRLANRWTKVGQEVLRRCTHRRQLRPLSTSSLITHIRRNESRSPQSAGSAAHNMLISIWIHYGNKYIAGRDL